MKRWPYIILTLVIFVLAVLHFWSRPLPLTAVDPEQVTRIYVSKLTSPVSGRRVEINGPQDVESIIKNLNSVLVRRVKPAFDKKYTSAGTIITISLTGGSYESLYIEPNSLIRIGAWFCRISGGEIDRAYLNDMFSKYPVSHWIS